METVHHKDFSMEARMEAQHRQSSFPFVATFTDPRTGNGRQQSSVIILALLCCAIMCGAKKLHRHCTWHGNKTSG